MKSLSWAETNKSQCRLIILKLCSQTKSSSIVLEYRSISPATYELANSVNTLHVAVANYPSHFNYNLGSSFFPGFSVLVPGLTKLLSFLSFNFSGSEDIVTKLYFGGYVPSWGWGLGSSAVADAYISFGPIGVTLIFILLGYFFKILEIGTFCRKPSPYFLVLSICCYSQIFPFCRGPFFLLFLSLSYSLLLIYFALKIKF